MRFAQRLMILGDALMALLFVATRPFAERGKILYRQFDLDAEANVATWYASAKWLLAAVIVGLCIRFSSSETSPAERRTRWLLAAFFLALSADEVAQGHEWAGRLIDRFVVHRRETAFQRTGYWMVFAAIAAAGFTLWAVRQIQLRSTRATLYLGLGMALVILGGACVEALSNLFIRGSTEMAIQVLLEETLENVGASLCVVGMLEYAAACGVRVQHLAASDRA